MHGNLLNFIKNTDNRKKKQENNSKTAINKEYDNISMQRIENRYNYSISKVIDSKINNENNIKMFEECNFDCKICNLEDFICNSWKVNLSSEYKEKYFISIKKILHSSDAFFPPVDQIFKFSCHFDLEETRVVILGQDPYHNERQAMGLSFSVNKDVKIPPSLVNIFKEIKSCYNDFIIPKHGSLVKWADQGVLLLNDSLTVLKHQPGSHSKIGWERFTLKIIQLVNSRCKNVVFMLWGNFARQKLKYLDSKKHLILTSAHPSPFSAYKFFGNKHFLLANEYLSRNGQKPIKW